MKKTSLRRVKGGGDRNRKGPGTKHTIKGEVLLQHSLWDKPESRGVSGTRPKEERGGREYTDRSQRQTVWEGGEIMKLTSFLGLEQEGRGEVAKGVRGEEGHFAIVPRKP